MKLFVKAVINGIIVIFIYPCYLAKEIKKEGFGIMASILVIIGYIAVLPISSVYAFAAGVYDKIME
jgi:hypothetical protein